LRLLYTRDGHATAAALLEAALARSPDAPQEWQSSVRSMLVVALAAQPQRRGDAAALLEQIGESSPSQLLEVLVGLSDVAQSAAADAQAEIARLQLEAADRLWPDRGALARGEQVALRRIRAEALDRSGNRAEAAAEYAKLAADEPDNAAVQVGYGRFLLGRGDRESAELALAQWRRVAARSRPNTETWYEAKYSVALAQFQLGRNDEAARLIRYLQITPPGLEGSPWNDKFLALLKRCEP
jgi:tetratricopeptide (TPR) repeat protein